MPLLVVPVLAGALGLSVGFGVSSGFKTLSRVAIVAGGIYAVHKLG